MYSFSLLIVIFIVYINQIYSIPISNDKSLKQDTIQQVQSFYENIVDEVISYHSEAFLYSLYYDDDIKYSLLKINNNQYEQCINNIPHYIGMLLYDKHFETYKNIGVLIEEEEIEMNENDDQWLKELQSTILYHFKHYMNSQEFINSVSILMKSCQVNNNHDDDNHNHMKFMNQNEIPSYMNIDITTTHNILLYPLEQEIIQFMNDMYDDLKEEMIYRTNDSLYLILYNTLYNDD